MSRGNHHLFPPSWKTDDAFEGARGAQATAIQHASMEMFWGTLSKSQVAPHPAAGPVLCGCPETTTLVLNCINITDPSPKRHRSNTSTPLLPDPFLCFASG